MSLTQLPTVVLPHSEQEFKYQQICDALKRTFIDVSTVSNEPYRDKNTPFYWIVFTEKELLNCLYHYSKAVPIGYKLLLRYLQSTKNDKTLNYLMNMTQNLFKTLTICTSGIHNDAKNDIKTICTVLSGSFDGNFTDSITHLIETNIGSQKHAAAVSSNGRCHIVTPKWIYDCYINAKIMTESMYCPPLFCGFFISVTGIKSTEREQIKVFVKQYGGEYCQGLSQQCTHLIANQLNNNEKCKAAIKWSIPIIKTDWFYDHLKYKGCVDINKYILNKSIEHHQITMDTINNDNDDDDIDIGEDTELREVIQMINDHDNKGDNNTPLMDEDPHIDDIQMINDDDKGDNTPLMDGDQDIDDLCYLSDCVVLLLCLSSDLKKEARELLRRGKGTTLNMYHSMGTHVITSSLDNIKDKYPQCFDHCTVLCMDWLRHCDDAQSVVDCDKYNLLLNDVTKKEKQNISQSSMNEDEMDEYQEFIQDCLNMNVSSIVNKNLFQDITFNTNKLSLNEQRKVSKLITAGNGTIVNGGKECVYLVCSAISSLEFESNNFEGIDCVSIIYISECLLRGQLLNVTECISFLPQLLCAQQTNSLFQDLNICLSQFDNKLFERYRIISLLSDTNGIYHRSFHPNRCDVLICKYCKGSKYESAKQNNIPILSYEWLIDSIKNGKQMRMDEYILSGTSEQKTAKPNKVNHRKRSSILGDIFGENLSNALNHFGVSDDLCSPALATTLPPNKEGKEEERDDITKNIQKKQKQKKRKYENSITRQRKRKYKDLDFRDSDYLGEGRVSDDIDEFDDDKDILTVINNKKRRKTKDKKNKKNNGDIRKHITMKHKIGVLLTGIPKKETMKYEEIVTNLNGVVLSEDNYAMIDDDENDDVNFKYIVAPHLIRSEKIIIGIIRQKIIVKPSFLDSCKKAKKWLSAEPHSWMNDEELIQYIPSNGEESTIKDDKLKSNIDLICAIRIWRNIDIRNNCFYDVNVFIWLPKKRMSTYWKILACLGAHLYTLNDEENIEKQCKEIADKVKINEVFLANQDEIKQTAKEISKNNEYQTIFKSMRKTLTSTAKFWSKQKIKCCDADYILDWTLEGVVFTNNKIKKKDYLFEIK